MTAVLQPTEPAAFTVTLPPAPARPPVLCPTCRAALPGLLAGCNYPACVAAEIAADVAFDRANDY